MNKEEIENSLDNIGRYLSKEKNKGVIYVWKELVLRLRKANTIIAVA